MEMEPQTDNGRRLSALLSDLVKRGSTTAPDRLQRVLFMFASKIINEDSFIGALYGQRAVDNVDEWFTNSKSPPLDLQQHLKTGLLRVQRAVGTSCSKRYFRQIVVALEWSKNNDVVAEILEWAEKAATEKSGGIQRRSFSSLLSDGCDPSALKPSTRVLDCGREDDDFLLVLQVCGLKIISGWTSGKVQIYDSLDLNTCTEIIVGYDDGRISSWDVKSGILLQKLSGDMKDHKLLGSECLRWRHGKLVAGTGKGRIRIWQKDGSSFDVLADWELKLDNVWSLDLDNDHVVVSNYRSAGRVLSVCAFDGHLLRTVCIGWDSRLLAISSGLVITGGTEKVIRIWDLKTGEFLKSLKGHEDQISAVDVQDNCIVTADFNGMVMIGKIEEVLTGSRLKPFRLKIEQLALNPYESDLICFGRNFAVAFDESKWTFRITDFFY